jgi:hypothetical protein
MVVCAKSSKWIRTIFFVILFACPTLTAQANDCSREFKSTLEQLVSKNEFRKDRNLYHYLDKFSGLDLRLDLMNLSSEQVWIDMGSGEGIPLIDFVRLPTFKGKAVGITYAKPEVLVVHQRLKIMYGRYVENIPVAEIPKARVITDYYGPLSYSANPDQVLQKYLDVLEPGGSIYFHYMPGRNHIFSNTGSTEPSLLQWLERIQGVKLSTDSTSKMNIKITKIKPQVRVPELHIQSVTEGMPPHRVFMISPKTWLEKIKEKLQK